MITVEFAPIAGADGDPLTCTVQGLPGEFTGCSGQIEIFGTDSIASRWVASLGCTVDSDGGCRGAVEMSLGRETILHIARVVIDAPTGRREWDVSQFGEVLAIVNGTIDCPSQVDLAARAVELREQQRQRYEVTLGDASAPHEFRVLCVIERLLMSTLIRLPGVDVIPIDVRASGVGESQHLNGILRSLGWPTVVDPAAWENRSRANRPWMIMVMNAVRAQSGAAAAEIARRERDRILSLLALNRGAAGRPLATIVESLDAAGHASADGFVHEDEAYTGNLLGGFISGEDPEGLLVQSLALEADPLLRLGVTLYRQAVNERDPDIAFFRFWSILEVCSASRVPPSPPTVVYRTDSTVWPGRYNTTQAAAPRVYEFIKRHATNIDEASLVRPAADLYDAVRCWYARRNATAHYGAFDPADLAQKRAHWFSAAQRTATVGAQPSPEREWLASLREVVHLVLARELATVGRLLL
jgi:hypothetical protein